MKPSKILSAGIVLVLAFGLAGCGTVQKKRRNESTCRSGGQSGKCRNDSVKTSWVQRER